MPGILSNIFGAGTKGILEGAASVLDTVITNQEEKLKAQAEIQRIINEHAQAMELAAINREQAILNDTANARGMNTEAIKNNDAFIRRFLYYLAGIVVVLTFGLFYLIIDNQVPPESKDVAYLVLGTLQGALFIILNFFFGSSRGSENKHDLIKKMVSDNEPKGG